MRVLIACEFSGIVRDAFKRRGVTSVSCDLLPSENKGEHYIGDVLDIIQKNWDMMIAFPPCTHLAVSGARWFKDKKIEQEEALDFIRKLMNVPIDRICIENPISIISTRIRKPDQIIQPWMFGHGETKATCLWLKNLPKLKTQAFANEKEHRVYNEPPSPNRWKNRSRTYLNIANAMAEQWSDLSSLPQIRQYEYVPILEVL